MSRVPPAPAEVYEPIFGSEPSLRRRIHAQASHLTADYLAWMTALRTKGILPGRLVELVRLRVAFHNQCRSCMAIRYSTGDVSEELVCSLEKPEEAEDLTEPERAALAFADLMATDHLRVDDATFARLHQHFTSPEVMELCLLVGTFVGYGRMDSALAMTDDLPEEYADPDATVAPWRQAPVTLI
ncbi:carboxymuconolactone decarboxylase family protein [Nocardioides houyundeii]|uniref:carboxymuconolactone decarboxylase family protein n=1 Tax=Nocardioides houyundeii TaxID=2045452 RepID=UPI000C775CD9|nr:carboxymuconolactone decarboxylase family protein [Nocardioides houyundeii]